MLGLLVAQDSSGQNKKTYPPLLACFVLYFCAILIDLLIPRACRCSRKDAGPFARNQRKDMEHISPSPPKEFDGGPVFLRIVSGT